MEKSKLFEIYEIQISEMLSDKTLVSEMFNYFSQDDVEGFLRSLNRNYELSIEEFE